MSTVATERVCPRCKLIKSIRKNQPYCNPCLNSWAKEWRQKNPTKQSAIYKRAYWKYRLGAILKVGGTCIKCGEKDIRVLQINHKNGLGAKELRTTHPVTFYKNIVKGIRPIDDLEILCANDNLRYEFEVKRRNLP